ncbi:MAG: glycoside hydrolase family 57 protein [Rhodocyclaceae bacterium]|nr:glycoside hydrolase family 57 protein [Rhodocyclaceae bacterium]
MNMPEKKLDLVFLWHMHQPDYRDHADGEYVLPWVYLHALKDYTDMAAHLERHPGVRAVVNFVPVLLDQIEDYCDQFARDEFRDPLLRLLARQNLDHIGPADRRLLLEACFRSNHNTMLSPFPRYQRLHDLHDSLAREGEAALAYLSGAYFADLVMWYHLTWTGETERRAQPLLAELMSKGEGYTPGERRRLLEWIGDTLKNLLPRYRALQDRGQIELSATPHTHPLAPLLLDFGAARESLPDAALPLASGYPGGRMRLDVQIERARESHARRFGAPPAGMWPAEGALSGPVARQLADHGCRWAATGEGVLKNSLRRAEPYPANAAHSTHRPWRLRDAPGLTLFFRDERLSDLIGFEYAKWHGRDAARHLISQLEAILAGSAPGETPVVCIALDGENAWEHYPYNGYYFFEDLYGLLENHPTIRTTTFSELLARPEPPTAGELPGLVAGSWVYGTLSTWIGDVEKNRAWDLLCAAKQSYDLVHASGRLSETEMAAAEDQLAVCESSDWFWWFGDYNPALAVASFDKLYRRNLANLYHRLKLSPPSQLYIPISRGSDSAEGGAMRRATE